MMMRAMTDILKYSRIFLTLLFLTFVLESKAQQFSVESFKLLPNDVTAFVDPVEDLNGDACALLKVECSPEFAFSTPLGIVSRIDKTGEIWLYLPKGSKKITIKHPKWGIIRDFPFSEKLDSHKTYELRISQPVKADVSGLQPSVTTVRDTLLVVRTDTLMVEIKRPAVPFRAALMATVGVSAETGRPMWGLLAMGMRRTGGFIHVMSDFGKGGETSGVCDKDGNMDSLMPFYSGDVRRSSFMANAGVAQRLTEKAGVFAGIGYGYTHTDWQLARSEGGGYVRNSHLSASGLSFEAGYVVTFGRISTAAYVSSVNGRKWWVGIGIGLRIGKGK